MNIQQIQKIKSLSCRITFVFVAILFTVLGANPAMVYAISSDDLNSIVNNTPFYDSNDPWCASEASTTGTVTLVGNDNLQQVFNYFASNGYTQPQAAGIVGNVDVESHGDPEIWEGNGQDYQTPPQPNSTTLGWGIVQWTPASKLLNDAQAVGTPAYELSTQVGFLWNQLNGTAPNNNEQPAGNAVKQTATASTAAIAFMQYYERPQDDSATGTNAQVRSALANQALALYGSSSATQASLTSSSATTSSGCNGTSTGLGGTVTGCNFGTSTGPFTTSSTAVTTFAKEISVTQMCQNVQDVVYNHSSAVFKQWLDSCGNPNGPSCAAGWCGLAVAIAWGYKNSGYSSAADPNPTSPPSNLVAAEDAGVFHAGNMSPPVGALLFYKSISVDGHVAIYLGNNMVMSSDVVGPGVVGEDTSLNHNGYIWIAPQTTMMLWSPDYLGWSEPIFAGSQYQSASTSI